LGIKGFLQTGLIVGQLIVQFIDFVVNLFAGQKSLKDVGKLNWSHIKQVAKEYSNFPKYELPHGLLNSFAANLPVLLLSFYFDMEIIGFFAMSTTLGYRPIALFSNSVYQVLYKKLTEKVQRNESIKKDCVLFCKYCVLIGLLVCWFSISARQIFCNIIG
jgi:O-antigen/teichoic acid export membrane protein